MAKMKITKLTFENMKQKKINGKKNKSNPNRSRSIFHSLATAEAATNDNKDKNLKF